MQPLFNPSDPGLPLLEAPPIPWPDASARIAAARAFYFGQADYPNDPDIADARQRTPSRPPRHS